MLTLDTLLAKLTWIKAPFLARLKKLDLENVGDVLYHFPSRYEDYATILPLENATPGLQATFAGTLSDLKSGRTFHKRLLLTTATLTDDTGSIRLLWFNQPLLVKSLRDGMRVRVSGKVSEDKKGLLLSNPGIEAAERGPTHTGRLVPVYPETTGITSKFLRWQLEMLLKRAIKIDDPVPPEILQRLHLPSLSAAFKMIHSPRTADEYLVACKRFAFEEMFFVQLKALQVKLEWDQKKAVALPRDEASLKTFTNSLPFQLTQAQIKAAQEISRDLEKPVPMNRLLNGDVGSGKTVVAALATLQTALHGYQVALLAPTEVLAKQHFESIRKLFPDQPFEVALLTQAYQVLGNEMVTRPTLVKAIQSGIARVIIATHAILQKDLRFNNLAFIIVDEQHRFGVAQRAYLQQEAAHLNDGLPGLVPHFLTMTATPIPRTLALAFFGNLDLSLLDEVPAMRKPILTRIAKNEADRRYVYDFIRREIKKGRQAFVIFPLVEESQVLLQVKAAVAEHKRLSEEIFPDLKLGLLHGRMAAKGGSLPAGQAGASGGKAKASKERVMEDFKNKKYDILVSTSVVEVGIDIPNASVMMIEEAERFGLSQLHQFRGRVGRSEYQSYCFLLPGQNTSGINERLQAMVDCANGFELAEKDLQLRGPGALFGTRQSGLPDIAMQNIANVKLIHIARDEAAQLLQSDPALKNHLLLQEALKKFEEKIHLE